MTEIQRSVIVALVELNATMKEGDKLANLVLLRDVIKESGMTMTAISKKTGIVRETLYNRIAGKGDFTASEIVSISTVLNMDKSTRDKIFLS